MSQPFPFHRGAVASLVALALFAPPARAQLRGVRLPAAVARRVLQRGGDASKSTVAVALTADGRAFEASGAGQCRHAPRASIYNVAAALWTAELAASDNSGTVALTFWRLASGGTQFTLALNQGRTRHDISTVKGGTIVGSGTVTLQPKGDGGEFTVDGTTADGVAVRGTIRCDRFTPMGTGEGG